MEHKITLLTGYTDPTGKVHRDVTFAYRLSTGDAMQLDNDPRSASVAQGNALILKRMITAFGGLRMPVSETVILGLDAVDRQDLQAAANRFLQMVQEETGVEGATEQFETDGNWVSMLNGFKVDGVEYPWIQFGTMTTGNDEVAAESLGLQRGGQTWDCFLIGRQIVRIESADRSQAIDGPVTLEVFKTLPFDQLDIIRAGVVAYRVNFRIQREEDARKRNAEGSDISIGEAIDQPGGSSELAGDADKDVSGAAVGPDGGKVRGKE